MLQVKTTLDAASTEPVHRVRRARPFRRPLRMWFTAATLALSYAALAAFMVLGAHMALTGDRRMGYLALGSLGLFVVVRVISVWLAASLTCALCHGGVLQSKRCKKHGNAQRFPLLSYRATVVLSTLFTLRFTCMYCGSPFRLRQ